MLLLLELRELAKTQSDIDKASVLRNAADEVAGAITAFAMTPSRYWLTRLNGAWANAERILKEIKEPPQPLPPISGAMEAEQMKVAA